MKRTFSLFLLTIILNSCENRSFNYKIIKELNKTCAFDSCQVRLRTFTDFKWERFTIRKYIFRIKLDSILGFSLPYSYDMGVHMVFVYGNQIVYHDDEFSNPESKSKQTHLFFQWIQIHLI
jgi:hypothetical protein